MVVKAATFYLAHSIQFSPPTTAHTHKESERQIKLD